MRGTLPKKKKMDLKKLSAPKVFISYSWTTPEHESWVLDLATGLRESGVNAILDKWDLREGHDAFAFMEQMVSDPTMSKVVIISDRAYAEKSDARKGGAGTEAQIISSEIYSKQDQDKFAVAVTELKESGEPYVPTYYKSRIFIDFSDQSRYAESFEQLLRWIADKPIHRKPEIGSFPKYITEPDSAVVLATTAAQRRCIAAIKSGESHAFPATKEYMELLVVELEKFRLPDEFDPLSQEILDNLQSFSPYRDEFIEVIRAISLYANRSRFADTLHEFFEKVHLYCFPKVKNNRFREIDVDNFRFIIHELFLHVSATLISEKNYSVLNRLLEYPYYVASRNDRGDDPLVSFSNFRSPLMLFDYRKQELKINRISLVADMLKQRCAGTSIDYNQLMQADFLLFVRSDLIGTDIYNRWYPDTLALLGRQDQGFEIFQRARSAAFFETIRPLLGGLSKDDLAKLLKNYDANSQYLPRGSFSNIKPRTLMAFDKLSTLP